MDDIKDELLKKIYNLPEDMILIIKEFLPKRVLVFTNRENYSLYHHFVKKSISDYENYIRDMIRRDNSFVFEYILNENYKKWETIKKYKYKNMIFNNYFYFTFSYCIENESTNCRNIITNFLKIHGLGKNLHKKNVVKYIRWKD
jgi:hypothetical protein